MVFGAECFCVKLSFVCKWALFEAVVHRVLLHMPDSKKNMKLCVCFANNITAKSKYFHPETHSECLLSFRGLLEREQSQQLQQDSVEEQVNTVS